jgi:hypothetical protein
VADPSLFVACAVYSFGWNLQKDLNLIAKATLLGHLLGLYSSLAQFSGLQFQCKDSMFRSFLECATQLTGGYFSHPCGKNVSLRDLEKLFHLSCPFADIDKDGNVSFGKLPNTGGFISLRTILLLFKILFLSTL